jgi:hypothetical protein
MKKDINELFALPTNTRQVTVIDGVAFYTSDSLIKATLKTLEKAGASSNYYPQLEKMIQNEIIIPCFLTKGIFSWVKRKVFKINVQMNDAFAMYYRPHKKVYIFMDNSMTSWGTAKNEEVAETVVHECMHLVAHLKPSGFYKAFNPYFVKYYSEVFHLLFGVKQREITRDTAEIVKFMRKEFNSNRQVNKILTDYAKLLEEKFGKKTPLDEEKFKKHVLGYIVSCKFGLIANITGNAQPLYQSFSKNREVFASLHYAYNGAFGKRAPSNSLQYQEMFDLTEVSSVYAELFPKSSIVKKVFRLV